METSLLDLPDKLIHHIFSYMLRTSFWDSNCKVLRLSLLSKRFHRLLQKRSVLVFDSSTYKQKYRQELKYICSTLNRYHRENIPLETFILTGNDVSLDVFQLAAKTGVRNLDINMIKLNPNHRVFSMTTDNVLPRQVFEFESLVELNLRSCYLNQERIAVWPNLKRLSIVSCVAYHEEVFGNLIRGCPKIEYLYVECLCFTEGFTFRVFNLHNLKELVLMLNPNQRLELNAAPNMESKQYPSLRILKVMRGEIDFSSINASRFPALEHLCLFHCLYKSKRINISSTSLKEIKLLEYSDALQEACFDAPNLVNFEYESDRTIPKLTFASTSNRLSSSSCIKLKYSEKSIDASWFLELNDFLVSLDMSETSVTVQFQGTLGEFSDEALPVLANSCVIPVPEIREFAINTNGWGNDTLSFECAILDGIFFICRPQTITFMFHWPLRMRNCNEKDVLKFLYDKLVSKSSHHRRRVTHFEVGLISEEEFKFSFKDWGKFLECRWKKETQVLFDRVSYHLEYSSGKVEKLKIESLTS